MEIAGPVPRLSGLFSLDKARDTDSAWLRPFANESGHEKETGAVRSPTTWAKPPARGLNFAKPPLNAWPTAYKPHWNICVNPRASAVEPLSFAAGGGHDHPGAA